MTKKYTISASGNVNEKSSLITLFAPYGEKDQKSVEVRFQVEAYPRDYAALDALVDKEYAKILEVLSELGNTRLRMPRFG